MAGEILTNELNARKWQLSIQNERGDPTPMAVMVRSDPVSSSLSDPDLSVPAQLSLPEPTKCPRDLPQKVIPVLECSHHKKEK